MTLTRTLPLAALALSLAAGCVPEIPAAQEPPNACRADDAARLVGQINPGEEAIRRMTGAATVRALAPNQPMTMDYQYDRATVVTDPVTHRVLQASCG